MHTAAFSIERNSTCKVAVRAPIGMLHAIGALRFFLQWEQSCAITQRRVPPAIVLGSHSSRLALSDLHSIFVTIRLFSLLIFVPLLHAPISYGPYIGASISDT